MPDRQHRSLQDSQWQGRTRAHTTKRFNPQPDPPTSKFLGGPDTKLLGGPDTKGVKSIRK